MSGKTIALINPESGNPFTVSMECAAKAEAEKLGVDLEIQGTPVFSVGNMTQVLNAVAARNPAGVVFPIWDPTAFDGTIENMVANGAKFVALEDPKASGVVSTITTDSVKGGELAGQAMLKVVNPGEKVLVLEDTPANYVQEARGEGAIEALEAAGVEVLPVQYTGQDPQKAAAVVSATLARTPDLTGIYVTGGTGNPVGAFTALKQEGRESDVALIAWDASPEQVEQIENGQLYASIAQRPDIMAATGVRYVVESLEGKSVPKQTGTAVNLVTKDNLSSPATQEALYKVSC